MHLSNRNNLLSIVDWPHEPRWREHAKQDLYFFSDLMSIWILGERPSLWNILCIVVVIVGAALVVKSGGKTGIASLLTASGLLGDFISGANYSHVRNVGLYGIPASVTGLCFSLFSCLVSLPFTLMSDTHIHEIHILCLVIVEILSTAVQLCLTEAYGLSLSKVISVCDYSQIIFTKTISALPPAFPALMPYQLPLLY